MNKKKSRVPEYVIVEVENLKMIKGEKSVERVWEKHKIDLVAAVLSFGEVTVNEWWTSGYKEPMLHTVGLDHKIMEDTKKNPVLLSLEIDFNALREKLWPSALGSFTTCAQPEVAYLLSTVVARAYAREDDFDVTMFKRYAARGVSKRFGI